MSLCSVFEGQPTKAFSQSADGLSHTWLFPLKKKKMLASILAALFTATFHPTSGQVNSDVWFLVLSEKNQTELFNRFSAGLSRVQSSNSGLKFNFLQLDADGYNDASTLESFCNVAASRYENPPDGCGESSRIESAPVLVILTALN